jgi:ABC-type transport system substrate-binding protein
MQKLFVGSFILVLCSLGWGTSGVGQEVPAPRGELRVVDKHPLNWVSITYNVFEHLMELDKDGTLAPRLATGWQWLNDRTLEVKLRQGVRFHNGEVFDAEIVKLNWEEMSRLQQPHIIGTFLNFQPGSSLEMVDPQTVRFAFPEPDGGALAKLSIMHIGSRQFYREVGWGEKHW